MTDTTRTLQSALLLSETPLLDISSPALRALVSARCWAELPERERIGAIYDFVRNEIAFGYNAADDLPASSVLADGYGQCNTKVTLLMALLRLLGIPCRFHGFTIAKALQRGAIDGLAYWLAPASIIHSWTEVLFEGRWVALEGVILDTTYLSSLQRRFPDVKSYRGYGVATPDLANPPVTWSGTDTYIQKDGIDHDFGVFDSPDAFYAKYGSNLSGLRRWLYVHVVRQRMNRNVARVRNGCW